MYSDYKMAMTRPIDILELVFNGYNPCTDLFSTSSHITFYNKSPNNVFIVRINMATGSLGDSTAIESKVLFGDKYTRAIIDCLADCAVQVIVQVIELKFKWLKIRKKTIKKKWIPLEQFAVSM